MKEKGSVKLFEGIQSYAVHWEPVFWFDSVLRLPHHLKNNKMAAISCSLCWKTSS